MNAYQIYQKNYYQQNKDKIKIYHKLQRKYERIECPTCKKLLACSYFRYHYKRCPTKDQKEILLLDRMEKNYLDFINIFKMGFP